MQKAHAEMVSVNVASLPDIKNFSGDHSHDDGRRRRRALEQDRDQNAEHEANDGVLQEFGLWENFSGLFSGQQAERRRQELQWADEEVQTGQSATYFCKNLKQKKRLVFLAKLLLLWPLSQN